MVVRSANEDDGRWLPRLCAEIRPGEIVVFDKAYVDFGRLNALHQRGLFWVTRAKEKMPYRVLESRRVRGRILRDQIVEMTLHATRKRYPQPLRRVTALVEVEGQEREMVFLTNHLEWAGSSVADLYRRR